ncbi:protein crooked neck-like [Vespa mandarinia]|uniref:protein crooked neck-like n=1 Tax=Vespa mandarinia TaxID=7446 RepID=UPI00161D2A4D|nr:protein crooked neck-like [Vespa mandarinia]
MHIYQYEQEVKENSSNYDARFDYLRLVKSKENHNVVRAYERAIANVPSTKINYALYEEIDTEVIDRCRQIYRICLDLILHKHFTFFKIWLCYAYFEIQQKNLTVAKKTLVWYWMCIPNTNYSVVTII